MRIAFPTQDNLGTESIVHGHFGSANYFIVVDTDSNETEAVPNNNKDHIHGQCKPLSSIGDKNVDTVVVGGIGGGALRQLQLAGIKVCRAVEGSIQDNLGLAGESKLPEFSHDHVCLGHKPGNECIH